MTRTHLFAALALLIVMPLAAPDTLARKGGNKPPQEPPDPAIAYSFNYKLMVVDADGANAATIRRESSVFHPSWSADGRHIAYMPNFDALWRVDVDGSNATQLVANDVGSSLAWSPRGDEIAYLHTQHTGTWEIRAVPPAGGPPRTVHLSTNQLHSLTYRDDGSRLAFVVDAAPGVLKVLDVATGVATTIYTMTPGVDHWEDLSWARTGDRLVFRRMPAGVISTYDMTTGVVTELFTGREPCWSPDDTQFAYVRGAETDRKEIWVYTFATGTHERIVRRAGQHPAPDWKR